jgi:dUTP pyrophosphatase
VENKSDNEGHIWIKLRNESKKTLFHKNVMEIKKGQAIAQGIILPYFTVTNDNTTEERNGGFGSTDRES